MNAQKFIDTMKYYGDMIIPDDSDSATILGAYLRGLGQYDGEILQLAAENILDNRNYRNYPLLPECVQACRDAQEQIAIRAAREAAKEAAKSGKSEVKLSPDYRIRQADSMMDSDIGRQAAQEQWIVHLHDFCREQGRLPNKFELKDVRAVGLANKATRDALAAKNPASLRIIAAVANAMAAKAQRLSAIALKQEAA